MSEQPLTVLEELHEKLVVAFERVESNEPTPVRRRRRRRAAMALAACAIAVCVAVVTWPGPDRGPLTTEQALAEVARGAVSAPVPFARDDQFTYTHSKDTWEAAFIGGSRGDSHAKPWAAMQDVDRRAWVGAYRVGALVEKRGAFHFITARDRRNAEASSLKDPSFHSDIGSPGRHVMGLGAVRGYFLDGDSGRMTRAQLLAYPTDPATIYRRVLKGLHGAGQGAADGVWQALTESLYESPLPPRLRAGMVRALGLIPGVKTLGERIDPLGRKGLAFGRVHDNVRDEVLFDPSSGRLLYTQSVLVKPGTEDRRGWPAGTVVGRSLQYDQRVVDRVPARYRRQLAAENSRRP